MKKNSINSNESLEKIHSVQMKVLEVLRQFPPHEYTLSFLALQELVCTWCLIHQKLDNQKARTFFFEWCEAIWNDFEGQLNPELLLKMRQMEGLKVRFND